MDFLGCRVFPRHMVLNRRSRVRFRRKLRGLERAYLHRASSTSASCSRRATALVAFTRTPGAFELAIPPERARINWR